MYSYNINKVKISNISFHIFITNNFIQHTVIVIIVQSVYIKVSNTNDIGTTIFWLIMKGAYRGIFKLFKKTLLRLHL